MKRFKSETAMKEARPTFRCRAGSRNFARNSVERLVLAGARPAWNCANWFMRPRESSATAGPDPIGRLLMGAKAHANRRPARPAISRSRTRSGAHTSGSSCAASLKCATNTTRACLSYPERRRGRPGRSETLWWMPSSTLGHVEEVALVSARPRMAPASS